MVIIGGTTKNKSKNKAANIKAANRGGCYEKVYDSCDRVGRSFHPFSLWGEGNYRGTRRDGVWCGGGWGHYDRH